MLRLTGTDETILVQLRAAGVLLESPCNGKGLCGKCKIRILRGRVSPAGPDEQAFLTPEELRSGIRLACMAAPLEPVELDPQELLGHRRGAVLGEGSLPPFSLDPDVSCRPENGKTAVFRDGRLLEAEAKEPVCGLAVDIGTTTVAVTLADLRTGAVLGEDGFLNPQKAYGLDVLSRIHYDMEHTDGVKDLQRAIVQALQESAERLGAPKTQIYQMTVGGNATMLHALLGAPLASLGRAPYSCVFTEAQAVPASSLGFSFHPAADVWCLPSVSAYIGGDVVAGALAARLDEAKDTVLFLDVGTNGEIILCQNGKMAACACAAGPALEGMNISCGMRAAPGAVERVVLRGNEAVLGVIGKGTPKGLCGSGLLDAVSQAVACGLIGKSGRIAPAHPLCATDAHGKRLIRLTGDGSLSLTQNDIRQVQLCKGAILSGCLTLMERLDVSPEEIDRVLVAGQFGKHLASESLVGAGILPAALGGKISYLGNASKSGAMMCLLSRQERSRAQEIARGISYIELSTSPGYERRFTNCLQFATE